MGQHLSAGVLSKSTLHTFLFRKPFSCNVTMNANNFPLLKQKQIVKEGQVLCFIEQLGGELPIEVWFSNFICLCRLNVKGEGRIPCFPMHIFLSMIFFILLASVSILSILI